MHMMCKSLISSIFSTYTVKKIQAARDITKANV